MWETGVLTRVAQYLETCGLNLFIKNVLTWVHFQLLWLGRISKTSDFNVLRVGASSVWVTIRVKVCVRLCAFQCVCVFVCVCERYVFFCFSFLWCHLCFANMCFFLSREWGKENLCVCKCVWVAVSHTFTHLKIINRREQNSWPCYLCPDEVKW